MAEGASPVYVIMAFPISNYQRFKNTMMRNKSILGNYNGVLVCSAPEVKCSEGRWPGNRTMAIIHFASERNARQYLESDPTVKQPDFMDGMDIIMVHTQRPNLPTEYLEKSFFVVADVIITDPVAFQNEYSPKVVHLQDEGKVTVSVVCPTPVSYRGTWKPHMIIINQWSNETAYNTFYNSDEYAPIKSLRQRITQSNVVTINNVLEH